MNEKLPTGKVIPIRPGVESEERIEPEIDLNLEVLEGVDASGNPGPRAPAQDRQ